MGSGDSGLGTRGWGMALVLALSSAAMTYAVPRSNLPARGSLQIIVRVYDYAGVSRGTLKGAEEEASRIFHDAGVDLAWLDCATSQAEVETHPACELPPGAMPVDLRILPPTMAARLDAGRDELGRALPSAQAERASTAWMFYQRVELLAESKVVDRGQILGHAIAHEIGHLLLGPNHHSQQGIMRANWDRRYLEEASRGQLNFTRDQAERIRVAVQTRSTIVEANAPRF